MRFLPRRLAVLLVAGLVAAACSSSSDSNGSAPDDDKSTTQPSSASADVGPTTGLTDTTIKIAVMVPDFGALAGSGLVPDLGDPQAQTQAYIDDLNEAGGIAGRQIEATYHTFDPADFSGASAREACIAATEDDKAFVVVGLPSWQSIGSLCAAGEHRTPVVTQTEITPSLTEQTDGRVFSLAMDLSRQYRGWPIVLDKLGELKGKTIGIITGDDGGPGPEAVKEGLEPALKDLGYDVKEKIVLPCKGITCEQHDAAVQRFRRAGIDYVFDALGAVASPTFIGAAASAGYHPEYTFGNVLIVDTVAKFHESVKDEIDGMIGVGDYAPFNDDQPPEEDDFARKCNELYATSAGVERHPVGSDAAGMTGSSCTIMELVKRGAEAVDDLGQDSFLTGLESLGKVDVAKEDTLCDPEKSGSFGPGKHDLANYLNTMIFDAKLVQFQRPEPCVNYRIP